MVYVYKLYGKPIDLDTVHSLYIFKSGCFKNIWFLMGQYVDKEIRPFHNETLVIAHSSSKEELLLFVDINNLSVIDKS